MMLRRSRFVSQAEHSYSKQSMQEVKMEGVAKEAVQNQMCQPTRYCKLQHKCNCFEFCIEIAEIMNCT